YVVERFIIPKSSRHFTHRDLHSFPTRRSSDLSVRARTVWILALSAATTAALAAIPGPVTLLIAVAFLAGTTRGIATLLQATAVSDRKSTRLNSSHVKISYAVFCLKKKNTLNNK